MKEQSRKIPDQLVLLIHGTFAHSNENEGDAWWQRGSTCWNGLKVRLPEGTILQEEGSLFRWDSLNSASARRRASVALLNKMTTLEAAKTYYHLVGHSHGGAVIWDALREAERTRMEMAHLGSVTTVGTPFIHFAPAGTLGFYKIRAMVIGGLAILPVYFSIDSLPELFRAGYVDVFAALFNFFALLGFLALCFLALGILFLNLAPVLDVWAVKEERKLSRTSFLKHGSKWLGLWSPDDEAINGLRRSLELDIEIVLPKPSPKDLYGVEDIRVQHPAVRMLVSVTTGIYNRLIVPFLDHLVMEKVKRYIYGNDRPAAVKVSNVSVWPTPDVEDLVCPPIPQKINDHLVKAANEAAKEVIPKLRKELGLSSVGVELSSLSPILSGKELVHTSYFDNPDVLEIIAGHIRRSSGAGVILRDVQDVNYVAWFDEFGRAVNQAVAAVPPSP